ncbi:BOLA class I histocompatibility antigen, alpha chain BL3-7-like isoform X2 [Silurus meridionalis]|uniref:BOLA class I histocompatibility antigen, alpha chain BL3-7-like isoform X2 n=1 Tax=Silurus meridionalis TaxID=175797 RepID=UPI001EEBCE16|nr:BOLA class I histocompatibility antigen, alpha chain BL3-7-like isoform X2 [Silurus meridionalis]
MVLCINESSMMKTLLILTCFLLSTLADTHTLHYFYTVVTAQLNSSISSKTQFTAVGLLDGEQFLSYSSSSVKLSVKDWMKKTEAETYWRSEAQDMQSNQDNFNSIMSTVMTSFNHNEDVHTLQKFYGCELHDGGVSRGYDRFGFDGEDFISLDLSAKSWTTAKPQAEILKKKWDSHRCTLFRESYLKNECVDLLKKFTSQCRDTLERKVSPTASLFHKSSPSPGVVCHATGFFPKALNISWLKNGEDVYEDVELSETLPNQDGSFQKRSILKVSAEELQEHTYTCVIEHSSLEKEIVLEVPKDGGAFWIIAGVGVALVVIAAVVAGIMVWRK